MHNKYLLSDLCQILQRADIVFQPFPTPNWVCAFIISDLILPLPITYSPLWCGLPHLFFHNKACHIFGQTFLVFQHTVRPSPMSTQHLILISQLIMALITGLQILWKNVTSCMKGHAFHTYYDKAILPRCNPVFMKISRMCSSMRQKYIQI